MNFEPLASHYPKLSALGEHCEDLIRDRHYRESIQGMRQFAEGVLKTVFRVKDDDEGLGALMRRDDFQIVVPRKVAGSFSLLQRYGNKASHFQTKDLPADVPYERHYEIRTKEDAELCLRHGHEIARWLLSCRDPSAAYPDFRPLETVRTNKKGEKRKIVFDAHQEEAIGLQHGRHLVLAPPGCGKTEILTERVRRALEAGIALTDMLCLTFTNRAARGMQERIEENFQDRSMGELYVGNLHRFCSKLLFESEAVPETATIIDEDDAREVIDSLARERLSENRPPVSEGLPLPEDPLPGSVADFIEQRAAELLQKDRDFPADTIQKAPAPEVNQRNLELFASFGLLAFDEKHNPKVNEDRVDEIARDYLAYKESQELLDFNDLLLKAWLFLTDDRSFVKRYSWIQVDEVQDLSPLQLAIVDLLWNDDEPSSVCVFFGDEQQAIFSFMGAKLERLQALSRTHAVHHLHRNFRSPSYLLDLFNKFAVNELDADPALLPRAERVSKAPKGALRLLAAYDAKDQIEVLGELARLAPADETTAVLVPSNAMADTLSNHLKEKGVEHFKISGSDIFRMDVLKTAKAYLGILKDDFQTAPWAQLISRLTRKNTTLKRIRDYLAKEFPDYGLLPSDLLHYSVENPEEPMSLLDDFTRAYWGELVVFDTETTGLEVGLDDVIQIAARRLKDGRCIETLTLFLETKRTIPKMLGNIPNPMVEEYEAAKARGKLLPPALAFKKFLAFVGDAPVVGHNVEYDVNIVNAQYAVLKDRMEKVFADGVDLSALPRAYARGELLKRYDTLRLSYALERIICREKGVEAPSLAQAQGPDPHSRGRRDEFAQGRRRRRRDRRPSRALLRARPAARGKAAGLPHEALHPQHVEDASRRRQGDLRRAPRPELPAAGPRRPGDSRAGASRIHRNPAEPHGGTDRNRRNPKEAPASLRLSRPGARRQGTLEDALFAAAALSRPREFVEGSGPLFERRRARPHLPFDGPQGEGPRIRKRRHRRRPRRRLSLLPKQHARDKGRGREKVLRRALAREKDDHDHLAAGKRLGLPLQRVAVSCKHPFGLRADDGKRRAAGRKESVPRQRPRRGRPALLTIPQRPRSSFTDARRLEGASMRFSCGRGRQERENPGEARCPSGSSFGKGLGPFCGDEPCVPKDRSSVRDAHPGLPSRTGASQSCMVCNPIQRAVARSFSS